MEYAEKKSNKITHLTATGRYAGAPFCGAYRGDDNGIHLQSAYQNGVDDPQEYIDKYITCIACKKAYAESGSNKVDYGPKSIQATLF